MNITVVGMGYVGLSIAALLARKHKVVGVDVDTKKIDMINNMQSPLEDSGLAQTMKNEHLQLVATKTSPEAYSQADCAILALPTSYNESTHSFDTKVLENTIVYLHMLRPSLPIIIKSTVPVGFTSQIAEKLGKKNLYFSPEFLREGQAMQDNLFPSRIIVGGEHEGASNFAELMADAADKTDIPILLMQPKEAEAVKLFANTYLAMRVAFFNELDTFATQTGLASSQVIKGVSMDPRIGTFYNNPSFGYGGYCLPKDTKQMAANVHQAGMSGSLISAIDASNRERKEYIVQQALLKSPKTVGIHRLSMKSSADNFRDAAVLDIIVGLRENGVEVLIYEPSLHVGAFHENEVVQNWNDFVAQSDLILANRMDDSLEHLQTTVSVLSYDIYGDN